MAQTFGIGTKVKFNGSTRGTEKHAGREGTVVGHHRDNLEGPDGERFRKKVNFHHVKMHDTGETYEHMHPHELSRSVGGFKNLAHKEASRDK